MTKPAFSVEIEIHAMIQLVLSTKIHIAMSNNLECNVRKEGTG